MNCQQIHILVKLTRGERQTGKQEAEAKIKITKLTHFKLNPQAWECDDYFLHIV